MNDQQSDLLSQIIKQKNPMPKNPDCDCEIMKVSQERKHLMEKYVAMMVNLSSEQIDNLLDELSKP